MNTLKLNISTPDGDAFAGEVAKLDLRGIEGELAVMAGHVPFLTAVKPGHCDIMLPDGEEKKSRHRRRYTERRQRQDYSSCQRIQVGLDCRGEKLFGEKFFPPAPPFSKAL